MEKQLSFYEFTQLTESEQYEIAFRKGEFIDSSDKGEVRFALYKLFNFYVEVGYAVKSNKIVNITSFLKKEN